MACLLSSGIAKGCKDNAGGLKRILLANTTGASGTGVTFTPSIGATADDIITSVAMGASADKFYEFVPNKMSSNWVENVQSNVQNGTVGYEQVLTMIFGKNEATKRNQVKLLGQAEVYAIVEDYNGKYFLLGEENGLELTGGSSSSGTTLTDLNGWNVVLGGNERVPAREIFVTSKSATDALINALLV